MKPAVRDAKYLALVSRIRRSKLSDSPRPKTPDWTPGIGGGIGAAGALLYFTQGDPSEWVRLAGVVCSAVAVCMVAWTERGIRRYRNETEQTRIAEANTPNVLITDDPNAAFDGLTEDD